MNTEPRILVVSDVHPDATLVCDLLRSEFDSVDLSAVPENAVRDFDNFRPNVLVLAFNKLEKAESYYLGLYRLSAVVQRQPHQTLILCNQDDLRQAYALCKNGYFDDYILFWPMRHDTPRLSMAVHHAFRQLSAISMPGPREIATPARHLADLEAHLVRYAVQSGQQLDAAGSTLQPSPQGGDATLQPVPQLEAAGAEQNLNARIRPIVLIVEDDEFQQKVLEQVLADMNLEMMFAASGTEALASLHKQRADLILMDVELPGFDGLETTRRLKSIEQFAKIPVVMITGHSEKAVIVASLKAGAADFTIKPYDREILRAKVRHFLYTAPT